MSRSGQIYQLINGLSRGEKRQFKLQAYKYDKAGKQISQQLFDILDAMKTWDESDFRGRVKKAGIDKSLPVHMNSLLGQVLAVLRSKQADTNIYFEINRLVEESMLLMIRDEFDLAQNRIRRAKKLALESGLHEKLVEVLMQERKIMQNMRGRKDYTDYRHRYFDEVKETITLLENEIDYFNLMEDIFATYYSIGYPDTDDELSRYAEIMENPLMKDISMAQSLSAQNSYYAIHALYHQSLHDLKKSRDVIKKQAEVYEQSRQYTKSHLYLYTWVLNNLAVMQSQIDGYQVFSRTLDKLRSIPKEYATSDKYLEQRIFELSYGVEMDFYFANGMMDEIGGIIPEVEKGIEEYIARGATFRRFLNLSLHVAIYHCRTGDMERSHHWIKKNLQYEDPLSSIYTLLFTMIVDLVIHFTLGDYKYLQYRIPTVMRYFKKHKQLTALNQLFFKNIRQLMRVTKRSQLSKLMANYKTALDENPPSLTKLFYTSYLGIEGFIENGFGLMDNLPE